MFDDLRDLTDGPDPTQQQPLDYDSYEIKSAGPEPRIFGMTAAQRFIISLMLLAASVLMSLMCLLVTGKLWLF
jgi:hypothetical protein